MDKVLLSLVGQEAKNLKKYATKEEINKLNFGVLNPEHVMFCIYGLMTGHCFSERACNLINKCAPRIYKQHCNEELYECELNGAPALGRSRNANFSPIECFISYPKNETNGNNKILINYLKGKRKTLKFKPF